MAAVTPCESSPSLLFHKNNKLLHTLLDLAVSKPKQYGWYLNTVLDDPEVQARDVLNDTDRAYYSKYKGTTHRRPCTADSSLRRKQQPELVQYAYARKGAPPPSQLSKLVTRPSTAGKPSSRPVARRASQRSSVAVSMTKSHEVSASNMMASDSRDKCGKNPVKAPEVKTGATKWGRKASPSPPRRRGLDRNHGDSVPQWSSLVSAIAKVQATVTETCQAFEQQEIEDLLNASKDKLIIHDLVVDPPEHQVSLSPFHRLKKLGFDRLYYDGKPGIYLEDYDSDGELKCSAFPTTSLSEPKASAERSPHVKSTLSLNASEKVGTLHKLLGSGRTSLETFAVRTIAAVKVQAFWRGYHTRKWLLELYEATPSVTAYGTPSVLGDFF